MDSTNARDIAGFHCHIIIKTIKQIKSTIKEIKKDEYSNSLTKVQVCAMFRAGDIRRNVLLKFIRLCMETTCLCPSQGHKNGGRKLTKTYVIEFCYKRSAHFAIRQKEVTSELHRVTKADDIRCRLRDDVQI